MAELERRARSQRVQPLVVREQFERWFEQAAEVLRAVDIPVDYDRLDIGYSAPEYMNAQWATLRRTFLAVDYATLSMKDHRRLHRQLVVALPKLLTKFSTTVISIGHKPAYSGTYAAMFLDDRRTRSQNVPAKITQRQQLAANRLRLSAAMVAADVQPAPLVKHTPGSILPARPALPQVAELAKLDRQLEGAARRLLEDWQVAWARTLGPEDRYRLEQIATSLLPELTRILPSLSDGAQAEAIKLVGEQLELLHGQVRVMLAQHELDALDALRLQTAFVREITAR